MINKINIGIIFVTTILTTFATPVFAEEVERQSVGEIDIDCDSVFNYELLRFLRKVWNIMVIIGPIVLIVMTLLDILKAISLADDSGFKKIINTFIRRFIATALLILLPVLINFVLGLMNSNFSTCI